jgi:hypothetical protein
VGVLNLVCAPPTSTGFLTGVGWHRGFTSNRGRADALHHSCMGTSFKVHSCSTVLRVVTIEARASEL